LRVKRHQLSANFCRTKVEIQSLTHENLTATPLGHKKTMETWQCRQELIFESDTKCFLYSFQHLSGIR
jgi:hypothetical protein